MKNLRTKNLDEMDSYRRTQGDTFQRQKNVNNLIWTY